jgi:hypothetical protein|tara:strand:- start:302 stop:703 length:402 start_codon:yes stop_codon:yes gene_type:complete
MAKLDHNPTEIDEGFAEGIYHFKVKTCEKVTFSTGNQGMAVELDIWNSEGVGFTTRENLVTTAPKAKWKLREFCNSLGLDFDDEDLDTKDFPDKKGKLEMVRKPGDKWLSVDNYLSVDAVANTVDDNGDDLRF